MNRYEQRAAQQRKAGLRFSLMIGTAGIALLVVVLMIVGVNNGAPSAFFTRAAIGVAVLLLVLRQVSRRLKGRTPKAAEPDPQSRLNLN